MSDLPRDAVCRNCKRPYPAGELDAFAWCERCRSVVLRRATIAGWVASGAAAVLSGVLVFAVLRPGPRFLIVWLVLIAALAGLAFKVTQRVAFEAIRSRGVPPPPES